MWSLVKLMKVNEIVSLDLYKESLYYIHFLPKCFFDVISKKPGQAILFVMCIYSNASHNRVRMEVMSRLQHILPNFAQLCATISITVVSVTLVL